MLESLAQLQKIRKRQLTWFGHVTRMEGERLPLTALSFIAGERSQVDNQRHV